jgi:uncharacterized membrane protein
MAGRFPAARSDGRDRRLDGRFDGLADGRAAEDRSRETGRGWLRLKTPAVEPQRVITPAWLALACASLLCVLLLEIRSELWSGASYRFLIWNLFLAWLPLLAAGAAVRLANRRAGGWAVAALLVGWLLFFPNAPYLLTDLIHLVMNGDYRWVDQTSLKLWVEIVLFAMFGWVGLLLGYLSLRLVHGLLVRASASAIGWLFVVAASFLGGFGVYLGRVARLNSWDAMIRPLDTLDAIRQGMAGEGPAFALLFGAMILTVYLCLYGLESRKGGERP